MSITLTNASYSYPDGSLAVESVTLEIRAGERVAIVGQNGAGKTTTAKMLNGLLKPSTGTVEVDGIPTQSSTTATIAQIVGYVFQNPDDQLFGSSVRDELEFLPRRNKWDAATMAERVTRAAELAGITEHLDSNPNDLPFAVRKFVAIGAILVNQCRYVILDEPTAGLDSQGLILLNRLIDVLEAEGVAVVTITHDMRFVAESFSRVVVMAHRQIVADGRAAEVFSDDVVLRTARIKRPEVAQLSRDLNISDRALTIEDVVALLA